MHRHDNGPEHGHVQKGKVTPKCPALIIPRVAPLVSDHADKTNDTAAHHPVVADTTTESQHDSFRYYTNLLGSHFQLIKAGKMQILVVRNAFACVVCAVVTNACYYAGNVFSLKPSSEQSRPELLMATLIWTALSYCGIMLAAHLPSLMALKFLECSTDRPTAWFCAKKLMKGTSPYFFASVASMACLGLLVQHTSLMDKLFRFKLHFYLGVVCNLTFTAGITIVSRRIYYEETHQGSSRRGRQVHPSRSKKVSSVNYRRSSLWRGYRRKLPDAVLVALAGMYIHGVSWHHILDRGSHVILLFAVGSILLKLAVQEVAKWYVIKKGIRSLRVMCVLVGVPTVLIDTQARIVLLGTQTNSFLATGTFAMVIAEVFLRAGKSAFVVWTINQRGVAVDKAVKELVQPPALIVKKHSSHGPPSSSSPSSVSLRMEFEQWRRQVLSYHTAEITADMYAEYIAIGCSQSIVFWYVGHPYYPALQLTRTGIAKWRLNQLAMLFFQFAVEIVVDYVCVVLEMAAGIEFDRIKGLSGFLGVFFMTMAVLNINISVSVYLSWGSHQDNH